MKKIMNKIINKVANKKGVNIKDAKEQNKLSILKLLATNRPMSRIELARATGLTKMTLSNLVSELINDNIIVETSLSSYPNKHSSGRRPMLLTISDASPCICGLLIRRDLFTIVITDLKGTIIEKESKHYPPCLTNQILKNIIKNMFDLMIRKTKRALIGIGISSIGPIDETRGLILAPPDFGSVSNFKVIDFIKTWTDLPVFLINDVNSAALAEKLYGIGKEMPNYIYLHIMHGIGVGFVLNNTVYTGNLGESGEIGHTSINFEGPLCSCGSKGCLDCYTNTINITQRINELSSLYPCSPLLTHQAFSLINLIDNAHSKDNLAMIILDEFCTFLSYALINVLTLIDCSQIIIGYEMTISGYFIENSLLKKVTRSPSFSKYKNITIDHSFFGSNAPLIGSIAIVSDAVFNGKISININIKKEERSLLI